jgi:predicted ATP-dependent endonuclease of OLD family
MLNKSKLVKMEIYNLGCIGPEGLTVDLDDMLCLVGPNNTGKSTVLRAYELAVGNQSLKEDDKCKRSSEKDNPTVILYIHIPEKMANIAKKWKSKENGYLLVRSKWEWDLYGKVNRQTYDPVIEDYSPEKAAGLDQVFSSRLPIPFRIGALEDPEEEHNKLLKLILQPISERLREELEDESSNLSKAISDVSKLAGISIAMEKTKLSRLKDDINRSHNEVFPNLEIDFNIDIGSIEINPIRLLIANSSLKFYEWSSEINWNKQGTGSQRALFWAMMQVRSELKSLDDRKRSDQTQIEEKKKTIKKLRRERKRAIQLKTKLKKFNEIKQLAEEIANIVSKKTGEPEFRLPGYMLLIDEPEVALHPNAIRAASGYLYNLSKDDSWQVMLSTHSPAFINPLEDHTTIVRLDRKQENPTPKTFRSDSIDFEEDERERLKLLNRFDLNLSEMFFGGYPIVVEGDTEFASFEYIMNSNPDPEIYKINDRPIIIRARGKHTIILIIKILSHFKVDFSVLHDADFPYRRDGKGNSAWSSNKDIFDAIAEVRKKNINVIHRVSIPYFELEHTQPIVKGGSIVDADSKDKPWNMINEIKDNSKSRDSVKKILDVLMNPNSDFNPYGEDILKSLKAKLKAWAEINKIVDKRIC